MMDEFMQRPNHMQQQSAAPPFAMEQLRREMEGLHTGPQQHNGAPWASTFDPGHLEAFQRQENGAFDPAEFERYVQQRQTGTNTQATAMPQNGMSTYQRPMGMGYSSMGGMGMGMGMGGMGMQRPFGGMNQQPEMQGKGKGRMVELDDTDWEAQFAQLAAEAPLQDEALDEEAQRAMEAELGQMDRSVNSMSADYEEFERIWKETETKIKTSRDFADNQSWSGHAGEFGDWGNFDESPLNTHLKDPEAGNYLFEEENVFRELNNPFDEGVRIMDEGGNLSVAALAFEAAVQRDPSHVEAWTRLGASQAQNEKESPAIRALEQAIKLDPSNLDALMGLAVSYTNEGYDSTAYRTLERWLSTKYPQLAPATPADLSADIGFTERSLLHQRVTDLFINAAQLSPEPEMMDPDVQVGLGVLFYGAEEYDKAVDCFSAALHSSESGMTNGRTANQRPLLWNRLGATLANSGRSEEAITAYEKALELNPNFVRARYNLGVSCINIGCYFEAAQHLLGALDMHRIVETEGREAARSLLDNGSGPVGDAELEHIIRQNQSTNLYDTLRRVLGQMDRKDLAEKVGPGMDPAAFRAEFAF